VVLGDLRVIAAVIPTRYNPPTLQPLLDVLEADGVKVFLLQSKDFGNELHVMWNTGIASAKAMGATEIAILNDDITILPGTMQMMADGLRMRPNAAVVFPMITPDAPKLPSRVSVWIPTQEGCGHCFMIKAELTNLPRFPEEYHLWHGDIIFFEQVRKMGYEIVSVMGLFVDHIQSFSIKQVINEKEVAEDQLRRFAESTPQDWTGRRESYKIFRRQCAMLAHRAGQR
jgi:hypothetical protein